MSVSFRSFSFSSPSFALFVTLFVGVFSLTGLQACSTDSLPDGSKREFQAPTDGPPNNNSKSSPKGILFAGVDAAFKTSALFYYDFSSGEISTLAVGGSGDPKLSVLNENQFLLANRSAGNQNLRMIDVAYPEGSAPTFKVGSEVSSTGIFSAGDPHAFLALSESVLLVAQFIQSKIEILALNELNAGKVALTGVLQTQELDTGGADFKPSALGKISIGNTPSTWIMHQGYNSEGGQLFLAKQQSLFIAENKDNSIQFKDMNMEEKGIQGLPLASSVPNGVFAAINSKNEVWVEQSCSRYVQPADTNTKCKAEISRINLETGTKEFQWQHMNENQFSNGPVIKAAKTETLYRMIDWTEGNEQKIGVQRFNMENRSSETVYTFEKSSGGFFALIENPETETLFIGERTNDFKGRWVILGKEDLIQKSPIQDYIPYSAVLVSQ